MLLAGAVITILGVLIVIRPMTSLALLGIYIGISCVVSGTADLLGRREAAPWSDVAFALLWIVAGIAILAWLGRSIELLPLFVAILLLVSGFGRLRGLFRGAASERALVGSFGIAEIAFGVFALAWPDVTLIVVAVLFGVRAIVFGVSLLWRGARSLSAETPATGGVSTSSKPPPKPRAVVAAARWMAAAAMLALAVGTLVVSHALRSGVPVLDEFYAAPAAIPPEPGVLLRSEPYSGDLPDGVSAWRILYTTTLRDGVPALGSGVVAIPRSASPAPRPVIAWAHGTVGIAQACAPSLTPIAISAAAVPALDAIVRNGWALVAADYPGMGTEGPMPYLVGEGEARSVLDAVRAARQLPSVALADETVIWGHSQGGHAALWTAQLAPSYAPEIDVRGTAALAPASDVVALAEDVVSKGPLAGIVMSFLVSAYGSNYEDVNLEDNVPGPARTIVREITARCPPTSAAGLRADAIVSLLSLIAVSRDRPIFDVDFTAGPFAARLAENVPAGPFTQPLLIAQGESDEVVAVSIQDRYVESLCASGQALEYRKYTGRDHVGVLEAESALPAYLAEWTRNRLEGSTPDNTCASRPAESRAWLDRQTPASWNVPGSPLPAAPAVSADVGCALPRARTSAGAGRGSTRSGAGLGTRRSLPSGLADGRDSRHGRLRRDVPASSVPGVRVRARRLRRHAVPRTDGQPHRRGLDSRGSPEQ